MVLPLMWVDKKQDKKNECRMFVCYWFFDLPEGQFLIGGERVKDEIVFTLTKKGETKPIIKSEAFKIEIWDANGQPVITPLSAEQLRKIELEEEQMEQQHRSTLLNLSVADGFPESMQDARSAVATAITRQGMDPREYYADIEPSSREKTLIFYLWHETALKQREDFSIKGDPSGKCRTVIYDPEKKSVIKIYGWR